MDRSLPLPPVLLDDPVSALRSWHSIVCAAHHHCKSVQIAGLPVVCVPRDFFCSGGISAPFRGSSFLAIVEPYSTPPFCSNVQFYWTFFPGNCLDTVLGRGIGERILLDIILISTVRSSVWIYYLFLNFRRCNTLCPPLFVLNHVLCVSSSPFACHRESTFPMQTPLLVTGANGSGGADTAAGGTADWSHHLKRLH